MCLATILGRDVPLEPRIARLQLVRLPHPRGRVARRLAFLAE